VKKTIHIAAQVAEGLTAGASRGQPIAISSRRTSWSPAMASSGGWWAHTCCIFITRSGSQRLRLGRIENLRIENGEMVLDPWPITVCTLKSSGPISVQKYLHGYLSHVF
jgi:hypothetical protein